MVDLLRSTLLATYPLLRPALCRTSASARSISLDTILMFWRDRDLDRDLDRLDVDLDRRRGRAILVDFDVLIISVFN